MRYVSDYPRSAYLLTTLEMAVFLRFLTSECKDKFISIHRDHEDPTHTGGHIYERLRAYSFSHGQNPAEAVFVCALNSSSVTFKVADIRSVDIGRHRYCHIDHPIIARQFNPNSGEVTELPWLAKYMPDMWKVKTSE